MNWEGEYAILGRPHGTRSPQAGGLRHSKTLDR